MLPRPIALSPTVLAVVLSTLFAPLSAQERRTDGPGLVTRDSPLQVVEPDANDRELRTTPVVRAVQRAADSVVSIYLKTQLARRDAGATGAEVGQGSGVILDENGLVITNWHVIAPVLLGSQRGSELDVQITLRDGRTRQAQVLTSSAKRDLALLQLRLVGDEKVKPIEIGRSADLMIGETVVAIGNPQGHANTVTSGVLSAIDRSIVVRAPDGEPRQYAGLLQTDAAINQGNSGGALLDITGRLIGINNAMAMGAENIGFAIPMDTVRAEFQKELIQSTSFTGAAHSPWIGLEVADQDGAVKVVQVLPGSPADDAGIKVGDVVRRVGETDVKTSIDYLRLFFLVRPMTPLPLVLERDRQPHPVTTTPLTRDHGAVYTAIGALPEEVDLNGNEDLVRKATLAFYRGTNLRRVQIFPAVVRLKHLQPDGPAAAIGLKEGDLVLSAFVQQAFGPREMPLQSLRDLAQMLDSRRGLGVRIGILRGDEDLVGTIEVRKTR
ncbi:MAG: trypsin-like peptidase domain-containing protein [Planctomycetes bacterium]|nr:trypsin-like peptidase domain-containing protein [Planctomycetota bacterium]